MGKPQRIVVFDAIDPLKMAHTLMSNTYNMFDNLYMMWMCIWMSPYYFKAAPVCPAFGIFWNPGYLLRGKPQHSVVVKAIESLKRAPISMSNKYNVCDNLHMLWMCIWMSPYHDRAAPVFHAFGSFPESWLPPEGQTTVTVYCGG